MRLASATSCTIKEPIFAGRKMWPIMELLGHDAPHPLRLFKRPIALTKFCLFVGYIYFPFISHNSAHSKTGMSLCV